MVRQQPCDGVVQIHERYVDSGLTRAFRVFGRGVHRVLVRNLESGFVRLLILARLAPAALAVRTRGRTVLPSENHARSRHGHRGDAGEALHGRRQGPRGAQ